MLKRRYRRSSQKEYAPRPGGNDDSASLKSGLSGDTLTESSKKEIGGRKTSLLEKVFHGRKT